MMQANRLCPQAPAAGIAWQGSDLRRLTSHFVPLYSIAMSHIDLDPALARRLWTAYEPYHAMIYFAPEAREAFKAAGLKGYWMGYFASRAAALGAVPAPVVTATFFNFAPRMVERAIPDAWRFCAPEQVLAVRLDAADRALRRLLGDALDSPAVAEAADLARAAVAGCNAAGRTLFAAHTALPWPEAPHLVLWQAATLLREFRHDGHIAVLLSSGLDGCEAHVTVAAGGNVPRATLQANRGWADEEWEAAAARLTARGWLDEAGQLSAAGREVRAAIEAQTDRLALPPLQHLGAEDSERLEDLLRPLSRQIVAAGGLPSPNPLGLPDP